MKIYHRFSRNFFVADFTTDFHGFFMAVGGIILGSMSEKIVGIFIIKKITFSTIRVVLSDRAVQRRVIYGRNSQ